VTRRRVFIDPDGTLCEWSFVVVAHPTGIVYEHQYGGTACRQGELEGYLVPVDGRAALPELRHVFEAQLKGTGLRSRTFEWPAGLLERVVAAVESIRFWPANDGTPEQLQVDRDRLDELDEAWIPVQTSDGPAVLLWCNSD